MLDDAVAFGRDPGSGGALLWTSPAGRRHLVAPERRVPAVRPSAAEDVPF